MGKRRLKTKKPIEECRVFMGRFNQKDFMLDACELKEVKRFGKFAYINFRKTLESPKNEIHYLKKSSMI